MSRTIPGLHHVTAISGPPQANVDFYAGLLRQRLVKKTVNFDAPDTYHLYYGDRSASPGNGGAADGMPADDGFHSVTLWVRDPEPTARLLTELFGYGHAGEEADGSGRRHRLASPGRGRGSMVDLLRSEAPSIGRQGAGTIHHVAFRAESDAAQREWRGGGLAGGGGGTPGVDP